jgi:hypothetical protein
MFAIPTNRLMPTCSNPSRDEASAGDVDVVVLLAEDDDSDIAIEV